MQGRSWAIWQPQSILRRRILPYQRVRHYTGSFSFCYSILSTPLHSLIGFNNLFWLESWCQARKCFYAHLTHGNYHNSQSQPWLLARASLASRSIAKTCPDDLYLSAVSPVTVRLQGNKFTGQLGLLWMALTYVTVSDSSNDNVRSMVMLFQYRNCHVSASCGMCHTIIFYCCQDSKWEHECQNSPSWCQDATLSLNSQKGPGAKMQIYAPS